MRASIATAYERVPRATADTRMVPAIAVPNEEPRLETLRDSPEISPCSCLGEARLHDVDRRREHPAEAEAERASSPGTNAQTLSDEARHQGEQEHDPGERDDEARDDQRPLRESLGEPLGGERGDQDAERRGGEDDAGLDRAVAANHLQEDGDDERRAHQQQPLDVLGDEREVARSGS